MSAPQYLPDAARIQELEAEVARLTVELAEEVTLRRHIVQMHQRTMASLTMARAEEREACAVIADPYHIKAANMIRARSQS